MADPPALPPGVAVTDVSDRGSDITEYICHEVAAGREFIVRSHHNRNLVDDEGAKQVQNQSACDTRPSLSPDLGGRPRPRPQGEVDRPVEGGPVDAVGGEDGHAVDHHREVAGQAGRVRVRGQFAVAGGPLETGSEEGSIAWRRPAAARRSLSAEAPHFIAPWTRKHPVCPRQPVQRSAKPREQPLEERAGGRLGLALGHQLAAALGVAVHHAAEQRLLVPERRVQARTVDAHRRRQVGERRPLVAVVPEGGERRVERRVGVERAVADPSVV